MPDQISALLRVVESTVVQNVSEVKERVEVDLGAAKISEIIIRHHSEHHSEVLLVSDDLPEPLTYAFENRQLATAFYHFVWEHFAELHGVSRGDRSA